MTSRTAALLALSLLLLPACGGATSGAPGAADPPPDAAGDSEPGFRDGPGTPDAAPEAGGDASGDSGRGEGGGSDAGAPEGGGGGDASPEGSVGDGGGPEGGDASPEAGGCRKTWAEVCYDATDSHRVYCGVVTVGACAYDCGDELAAHVAGSVWYESGDAGAWSGPVVPELGYVLRTCGADNRLHCANQTACDDVYGLGASAVRCELALDGWADPLVFACP